MASLPQSKRFKDLYTGVTITTPIAKDSGIGCDAADDVASLTTVANVTEVESEDVMDIANDKMSVQDNVIMINKEIEVESYNELFGPIPSTIGQLPILSSLDLSNNHLIMDIPKNFKFMKEFMVS